MDFNKPRSDTRPSEIGNNQTANTETVPVTTARSGQPNPKPKRKYTVFKQAVLIFLLLLMVGALSYLYYQQKHDNDKLRTENRRLRATDEPANSQAPTGDQALQNVKYIAKVGKFTLELPAKYTIVRNLDGDFEGGPATRLQIATTVNEAENVVETPVLGSVEVFAKSLKESESFDKFVQNDLTGKPATNQKDETVAGVTAEVYTFDGLAVAKAYYFTKSGVAYKITLDNTDSVQGQETLAAVLKGLKLN